MTDEPGGDASALAVRLQADIAALDRELAEIQLLIGQARSEAQRHEQKRVQATERLAAPGARGTADELAEGYGQLVTLTKRAALMEAQVEVLEGKHKVLTRFRAGIAGVLDRLAGIPESEIDALQGTIAEAPRPAGAAITAAGRGTPEVLEVPENMPASVSRVVMSAQEDLRREIARSMHDGPAQSLTNIVLQAQIVDRLVERDPAHARAETRLLVSMVQQTLDATKNFIFDVRPMVLDDLGLVPTLRRSTRERGRRTHIPVEFESLGQDRRLPMDTESAVFRILDEALAAYLGQAPERVALRLDWGEVLDARLTAHRTPVLPDDANAPGTPDGEVPEALRAMMQDREDARQAAIEAAREAAIVALPHVTRRDVHARAASIDATVEILEGGGELHLVVALPPDGDEPVER